jgi:adenosylcobinamide kinase / adenosylcobinamide-phosphate guanylyltransferase
VIVDCLTLWTSNLMWLGRSDAEIDELAATVAERAAGYGRPVLAITNEVGLGVHPETHLGRRYRDVLGRVNQRWVAAAEQSVLLVAGKAVELRDPWDFLPDPLGGSR